MILRNCFMETVRYSVLELKPAALDFYYRDIRSIIKLRVYFRSPLPWQKSSCRMVCNSESVVSVRSNSGPTFGSRAPFTHWSWDDTTRLIRASEICEHTTTSYGRLGHVGLLCSGICSTHGFITLCPTSEMRRALVQFKYLRTGIRPLICF